MALAGMPVAWAVESTAGLVADAPAAPSVWSGVGLWAAIAGAVLLGVLVIGKKRRSRSGAAPDADASEVHAAVPQGYSSKNVGNDASARPWERHGPALDAGTAAGSQGGYQVSESLAVGAVARAPEGFDTESFLQASKANFVNLQAAWDRSDVPSLRAMMTPGMLEQIKDQLSEREEGRDDLVQTLSEVVMLEAHLLGVEEQGESFTASVEFSGLLREGSSAGPSPFRELWTITRPNAGGGWLVADVQALQ
jgi:predicted lipid-binding transport protein (Tim44 family)